MTPRAADMTDQEERVVEIIAKVLFSPSQRKSWEHARERKTLNYFGAIGGAQQVLGGLYFPYPKFG